MAATIQRRLGARTLELQLLLTACLALVAGLGALAAGGGRAVRWADITPALAFASAFLLLSLSLALRGWGEDQLLLPIAALLAGVGALLAQRLEPALVARYGAIYQGLALRQMVWVLLGATLAAVISLAPWRMRWLRRYRYLWLLLGLLIVGATAALGVERNGARLWLDLGLVQVQPVEPLKILLVIYLAAYLDQHRALIGRDSYRLAGLALPPLPHLATVALMWALTVGMIAVERDLGAALLLTLIVLALLYLASGRAAYVLAGLLAFAGAALALLPRFAHVQLRMRAWRDPWAEPLGGGYQIIQALDALAQGGALGRGLGLGDPARVPESQTDFALVAVAHELGLAGAVGLLLCFGLLALRGLMVARDARDGFERLLAAGLTVAIVAQALVIAAGVTNLIPLTGVTLPLVSYGGSSTLTSFAMVALLLRISAQARPPEAQ